MREGNTQHWIHRLNGSLIKRVPLLLSDDIIKNWRGKSRVPSQIPLLVDHMSALTFQLHPPRWQRPWRYTNEHSHLPNQLFRYPAVQSTGHQGVKVPRMIRTMRDPETKFGVIHVTPFRAAWLAVGDLAV